MYVVVCYTLCLSFSSTFCLCVCLSLLFAFGALLFLDALSACLFLLCAYIFWSSSRSLFRRLNRRRLNRQVKTFIFCVALKRDYYLFSEAPLKRYTINHSGELDLRKSTLLSAFPRGEREREREREKERNASRALDKTVVEHARARKHR